MPSKPDVLIVIDQKRELTAIKEAVTNKLVIIDGYGGTGKTTILEGVVSVSPHETCYVLALSGKAKERAKESEENCARMIRC